MNRFRSTSLLFLLTLSLEVAAQTSSDSSLTGYSKAILFQVRSNFTLGSFQGAALSYKCHLQPSFAIRTGVSVSLNNSNNDGTQNSLSNDTLFSRGSSSEDFNGASILLNAQAIWYSESSIGIHFYYGTGPFISYGRTHDEGETISTPVSFQGSKSTFDHTGTNWSAGLSGLAGVEWFVSRAISLHAEYGVSLGYSWNKNEATSTYRSQTINKSISESTGKSWALSSNGVLFGMSVYFR
jgi:hypothetical protein